MSLFGWKQATKSETLASLWPMIVLLIAAAAVPAAIAEHVDAASSLGVAVLPLMVLLVSVRVPL